MVTDFLDESAVTGSPELSVNKDSRRRELRVEVFVVMVQQPSSPSSPTESVKSQSPTSSTGRQSVKRSGSVSSSAAAAAAWVASPEWVG